MTDSIELHCAESEGWPYDGHQTILSWSPVSGFSETHTSRHIDADGERSETTALSDAVGLARLQAAGQSLAAWAEHLAPVLARTEILDVRDGCEVRRLGDVLLLRTVSQTAARAHDEAEDLLAVTIPPLGRLVTAVRDGLYARQETAPLRTVVVWSWGTPEALAAAGWSALSPGR